MAFADQQAQRGLSILSVPLHGSDGNIKANPCWAPARRTLCCKGSSKNSLGLTVLQRRAGGGTGLTRSRCEEKWDAVANPKEESTHLMLPRDLATNREVLPSSTCQLWLVDTLYPCLHMFSSKHIALPLMEHPGWVLAGKGFAGSLCPCITAAVVLPWGAQPERPGSRGSLCAVARPAPAPLIYKPAPAQWGGSA